jgi:hypothetical protein
LPPVPGDALACSGGLEGRRPGFLLRRRRFQPVFNTVFRRPLVVAGSHRIIFLLLLVSQNATNPLNRRFLKHAKPFNASTARNRGVLTEQQCLLLSLLQDTSHGRLLVWGQLESLGQSADAHVNIRFSGRTLLRLWWGSNRFGRLCGCRKTVASQHDKQQDAARVSRKVHGQRHSDCVMIAWIRHIEVRRRFRDSPACPIKSLGAPG